MALLWKTVPEPLQAGFAACRGHLIQAALLSALINILYLAPTIYMMQVYDRVVPTRGVLTLFWITVVVGAAIAVLTSLDAVRSRLMIRASVRLNRRLGEEILHRSMLQSKAGAGPATTQQAMREFDQMRQGLSGPGITGLFDLPWTPLYVIVAFIIHPVLGGLVIFGGLILVTLAAINERKTKAGASKVHSAASAAYASQEAAARNAEVVRALGMRGAMVQRHSVQRESHIAATAQLQFTGSRYNSIVKFVRMFMQSVALGTGAWLAVKGYISVGAIIAASVLLSRALQPVEQVVGAWSGITQSVQAMEALGKLFDATDSPARRRTTLPEPEGLLELDRVCARTPDGNAVLLKNVSLQVEPGTILGIIGPSGAGKTTLARIASGAIPADLGEVRLDEANMADWDPDRLARHIGYLPQSCDLFPGTVGENISRFAASVGEPDDVVDLQVVRAAKMAGVHELILHLPDGYDTQIEGAGHRLSAGQAQRVALARALYGDPKVLILDEPNSALDADGEGALNRAIAAARIGGAAILIIAHKAAVLGTADRLLILHDGAVSRYGPRQEILQELAAAAANEKVVPLHEGANA